MEIPEATGDGCISQSPQDKEAQQLEKTILTKYLVAFGNLFVQDLLEGFSLGLKKIFPKILLKRCKIR